MCSYCDSSFENLKQLFDYFAVLQPFSYRFGITKLSDLFIALSKKKVESAAVVLYDSWTCKADETLFKHNLLISDLYLIFLLNRTTADHF